MTGNIHQNYNARDVINAGSKKQQFCKEVCFAGIMRPSKMVTQPFYRWLISDFQWCNKLTRLQNIHCLIKMMM